MGEIEIVGKVGGWVGWQNPDPVVDWWLELMSKIGKIVWLEEIGWLVKLEKFSKLANIEWVEPWLDWNWDSYGGCVGMGIDMDWNCWKLLELVGNSWNCC